MDELLAGLHDGGTVESGGRFTVDVLRQHEKLRQFQLADPGFYLLKVIQMAVALRAPQVVIRLRRDEVEVGFDTAQSLDGLPEALLHGQKLTGAFHHLSVALSGALAWDPVELTFEVGGHYQLRVTEQGLVSGPPPAREWQPRCYFRLLKRPPQSFLGRWFGGARANLAEASAVTERCRFAPVPVVLDGRKVNDPYPEALVGRQPLCKTPSLSGDVRTEHLIPRLAGELLQWVEAEEAGLWAPSVQDRRPSVLYLRDEVIYTGGSWTGVLVVQGDIPDLEPVPHRSAHTYQMSSYAGPFVQNPLPQMSGRALLTWLPVNPHTQVFCVVDGVLLNGRSEDLGLDGLLGVVADSRVKTDLSEFAPVEDEGYRQVVAELRELARTLGDTLRPHVATWQAADRLALSDRVRDDLRKRLGKPA